MAKISRWTVSVKGCIYATADFENILKPVDEQYRRPAKQKEISQDDQCSYIWTSINVIYGEYENQSYNICNLYKTRLQLVYT